MSALSLFIDDGYTLTGTVRATGPWPALEFTYRPALPERTVAYMRAPKDSAKMWMDAVCALLTEHVTGWNLTHKEQVQGVSDLNLRRIPQPYLQGMIDHVTGYTNEQQDSDLGNLLRGQGSPSSTPK